MRRGNSGKGGDMKRLLRWLSHGLTGLSLLLCVAMASLFCRSFFVGDMLIYVQNTDGPEHSFRLISGQGGLTLHSHSVEWLVGAFSGVWLGEPPTPDKFDTEKDGFSLPAFAMSRRSRQCIPPCLPTKKHIPFGHRLRLRISDGRTR